jgi:uncharacterized protein
MRVRTDFPHEIREIETLWVQLPDATRLVARVWLPADAEENPVPAILESIPYRRRDGTAAGDALTHPWWAGHGYAAIRLDIRGSGDSDGVLADEYLAQEQDDVAAAIAWIAAQPWCSGSVGMIGISWGGFAALQVAARRPPALKAIVTCCSTDDRYTDDVHYMGGCLLNDDISWGSGIFAAVSRPPDPTVVGKRWRDMWLQRLEQSGCPLIDWTRHQRRDDFWRHGSVNEDYGAIGCAVYAVGGWTDGYTNAILRLMENLDGPRRALIGPWTHVYPHFGTPGPDIGFLQESLRWWDRWLKGKRNGVDDEPAMRIWMQEDMLADAMAFDVGGGWIAEPAWPPPDAGCLKLNFGDHALTADGGPDLSFDHTSPLACGLGGGEWCPRDGGGVGPEFQWDQRHDDALSLCFDSAALDDDVETLGYPDVTLELSVDRPQAQIAVRLNEVRPEGHSSRVTYGLLNLSHRGGHGEPTPMVPGERTRITLRLNAVAYRFSAGCRLRLAVSTSYWPLAWPSPEPATLTLHTSGSSLALPRRAPGKADAKLAAFEPAECSAPLAITELAPDSSTRTLTHDVGTGEIVLHHVEDTGRNRLDDIGLTTQKVSEETFTIREGDPASARTDMLRVVRAERDDWKIRTETRLTFSCDAESFFIKASLDAFENDEPVANRRWNEIIPRDHL